MNNNFLIPFDPLKRAQEVERLVADQGKRKYYRFRPAPFYGGLATADAVGCCFLCAYCWNLDRNLYPKRAGNFYSADKVAKTLLDLAWRKNFRQIRISGAEPILGQDTLRHLIDILNIIKKEARSIRFILETNGFILGFEKDMAKDLARFENLLIRVSLKAVEPEKFEKITGAEGRFYLYPLQALINLHQARARFWPAIMSEFFAAEDKEKLKDFLKQNRLPLAIEEEELLLYPFIAENLRRRGLEIP